MNILLVFSFVFTLLVLRINGVEESKWNLSREEIVEIEKQIQHQNNHTVKTIRTNFGDLYDCVDFYKQPAFNHPLSKNLTFVPQKSLSSSHEKARNKASTMRHPNFGINAEGCPDGTVPIKRVSKKDFITAKLAQANDDKPAGTRYARCSVNEKTGYSGTSASLAVYRPDVLMDTQYSAAVMRLQIGPDSIEVGWRVDPKLYAFDSTRLYIRTDIAGKRHCFNTFCPGFVVTDNRIHVDAVLDKVSKRGRQGYEVRLSISNDVATGNWILSIAGIVVGYWPRYLFQQPGLAQYVVWGGEVFGPPGWKPAMGSGLVVSGDTSRDAYFSFVKVQNGPTAGGKFVDPVNLKCLQNGAYEVRDEGNVGKDIEYLIIYGGPLSSA